MNILIIDAQGGRIGKEILEKLRQVLPAGHTTIAVGTNALATGNMLKAGPDEAATGDNAIRVCARRADIICGPVGIVIADAMNGEVTPEAARAVGQADAVRVLIPVNRCDTVVVGAEKSLGEMIGEAVQVIAEKAAAGK